jgi:hypothetical protein
MALEIKTNIRAPIAQIENKDQKAEANLQE